jgi:hypothetical protein
MQVDIVGRKKKASASTHKWFAESAGRSCVAFPPHAVHGRMGETAKWGRTMVNFTAGQVYAYCSGRAISPVRPSSSLSLPATHFSQARRPRFVGWFLQSSRPSKQFPLSSTFPLHPPLIPPSFLRAKPRPRFHVTSSLGQSRLIPPLNDPKKKSP